MTQTCHSASPLSRWTDVTLKHSWTHACQEWSGQRADTSELWLEEIVIRGDCKRVSAMDAAQPSASIINGSMKNSHVGNSNETPSRGILTYEGLLY